MDLSGIFFSVWFQLTCFSLEQPAGARFHHVRDHGGQTKNIRNAHLDSNSRWWLQTIPSGYVKMAIENGHRNSLFTHKKWWLSIVMLVYQRVRWRVVCCRLAAWLAVSSKSLRMMRRRGQKTYNRRIAHVRLHTIAGLHMWDYDDIHWEDDAFNHQNDPIWCSGNRKQVEGKGKCSHPSQE